jgi:predicted PP-loop superfamily ATPase
LKRCIKCVLPENYPGINFDKNGCCNFCREHKRGEFIEGNKDEELKQIVDKYKGCGGKYDCIVAFSGGRDSSYILWYAVEKLKLKVLACFMDNGMVPEHTLQNVKNATRRLGIDLHAQKYDYLEKSVGHVIKSWMCKPSVGMIAIMCTGCAYGRRAGIPIVANEYKIPLMLVGGGEPALSFAERYLCLGRSDSKLSLMAGFALEVIKNPRYIIKPQCLSIMTLEFAFRFLEPLALKMKHKQYPEKKVFPYKYIGWNEQTIVSVITSELGWQKSPHSEGTWRSDCKLALFKNYLYQKIVGFNKHDDLFSGMIRNGMLSRDEALNRLAKERDVKEEFVKEFFKELGLNYDELQTALKKIESNYYS